MDILWKHLWHIINIYHFYSEKAMILTARNNVFPRFRIWWEAQKDQVNIIITSTFWLKKSYFPSPKNSKQHFFSGKNNNFSVIFPPTFCLKVRPYFPFPKSSKQGLFSSQWMIFHAKENILSPCFSFIIII